MLRFFEKKNIDPTQLMASALGRLELPTFQTATLTTLDLLRDPTSPTDAIARSIEVNPGLVTHLLRVVNSASYGLRQRITRVSHAISMVGRAQLESLIVTLAVRDGVQASAPKAAGRRFWQGAAIRASLARSFAEIVDPASQSEAFVTGLLEDMALPLLFTTRSGDYRKLLAACAKDPTLRLEDLERETFGWDHSIIGACVAHHWKLPDSLTGGIGGHHEFSEASPAVYIASCVRDFDDEPDVSHVQEVASRRYGVPEEVSRLAIERASAQAAELVQLLC